MSKHIDRSAYGGQYQLPACSHNSLNDIVKRGTFDGTALYAATTAIHAVEQRAPLPYVIR